MLKIKYLYPILMSMYFLWVPLTFIIKWIYLASIMKNFEHQVYRKPCFDCSPLSICPVLSGLSLGNWGKSFQVVFVFVKNQLFFNNEYHISKSNNYGIFKSVFLRCGNEGKRTVLQLYCSRLTPVSDQDNNHQN